MNKISNRKIPTLLIAALLFIPAFAYAAQTVGATQSANQAKTSDILSNVVGFDTRVYTSDFKPELDNKYLTLPQTDCIVNLKSSQGSLNARCSFINNAVHRLYLSEYQGEVSLKQQGANTIEMAKIFLQSYQNYANDPFYGSLGSMLNKDSKQDNITKTMGNTKLEVLQINEITDYKWTYIDDNGIIAPSKNIILSYENGQLKSFLNNWPLYIITASPKVSSNQATAIAIDASKNFKYEIYTDKGISTVSGFSIAPESLHQPTIRYLNYDKASSTRGNNPFCLYPSWFVELGFDKFYPGNVTGLATEIWADTGEIASMKKMVYTLPENSSAIDKQIEFQNDNLITMPLLGIVLPSITFTLVITSASLIVKRQSLYKRICRGKIVKAKSFVLVCCLLLSFSLALTVVPKVSATPTTSLSRSIIYTMVHGNPNLPPAEEGAIRSVDNFIGNTTANDGYVTSNLCGAGTTKQNILDYTADAETNYARVAVFHFGHFAEQEYVAFQDDNQVAVHWYDIDDYTTSQKHFFVWDWVCVQAVDATSNMPVAWTHRDSSHGGYMSNDGYNSPDSGKHCFMTFDGFSPTISDGDSTFNCTSGEGDLKDFIIQFYTYAFDEASSEGYSVKTSLDLASLDFFDCNFEDSVFSDWYHGAWYPQGQYYAAGKFLIFGNGNIKLFQPDITLNARDNDDNQLYPTFYIDGSEFSAGNVYVSTGYHYLSVSNPDPNNLQFWRFGEGTYWENPITIYPSQSQTYTAHFTDQYLLEIQSDIGGYTNYNNGFIDRNTDIYIDPTANSGYQFDHWEIWGSSSGYWTDYNTELHLYMNQNYGIHPCFTQTGPPPSHTITVVSYDLTYNEPVYTSVYVDGDYAGGSFTELNIPEGYHYIAVDDPVWNDYQSCYAYFSWMTFNSQYGGNPGYIGINTDGNLGVAYYS